MTKKKRIPKGEWGYFKSEKKRRTDHHGSIVCSTAVYLFYFLDLF